MHDKIVSAIDSHEDPSPNGGRLPSAEVHRSEHQDRETPDHFEAPPNLIPNNCGRITPEMLTLVELDQHQIDGIARTVPGGAKNVQDIYPLSPLQEGLLFHRLLNEQRDSYLLSTLFELESQEMAEPLRGALQSVIDRHDALRTAILWENVQRPVQVVYREAVLATEHVTLTRDRDALEQLRERMRPGRLTLDVQRAPIALLQLATQPGSGKPYALLNVHHLVCDHQSLETVVSEALSFLDGKASELHAPGEHRRHVEDALTQVRLSDSGSFFRRKLTVDEPTAPFGLTDVYGDGSEVEEARQLVDSTLATRIRAQAHRAGVSTARLFHAAWALVVAHTSGRDDIVFGTVVLAGRQRRAREQRTLGMRVNTLPLRLQLRNWTAKELLAHTHQELAELLNHEFAPLTLAHQCSGLGASAPLFTSLLNCRHSAFGLVKSQTRTGAVRVLARGEAWSNYPVAMTVDDVGDGFALTAQLDRRVGPHRLIDYLQTALKSLADALEQAPQTPALALSILPQGERERMISGFNATQRAYSRSPLVHELIELRAAQTPAATAVVCGNHELTYAQLNERANRLAHVLRARGVRPNERVAVFLDRGTDLVVGLLAILKAGGAYLPLDVNYPGERLAYMLQDSAPVAVLTQKRLTAALPPSGAPVVAVDAELEEASDGESRNPPKAQIGLRSKDLAYVIYTSGSTGTPKGVMVEHRNLLNLVHWHCAAFELNERSRCSCTASVSFDAATWEIWPPLAAGATLVVSPAELSGDPEKLIEWWAHQTLDVSFLATPLAELAFSRSLASRSLRILLVGGDRLRHRPASQSFALINNYGPTETAVVATSGVIKDDDATLHIGCPIANTQIYILDQRLQIVPIGVTGEIYVGGSGVARGYLNRPELTAERFIRDPFSLDREARLYRTGDLARWREDGTIEYLGRNDHQVKIRGFRIEPGEIERQLVQHEAIKDAVVVAQTDARGEKYLVGYVVPGDATRAPSPEDVRAYLLSVLAEHMVPSAFVVLEHLPLTPNGKLDRRALPMPERNAYASNQYEAPRGELEEILAGIWQDVLNVKRVGRGDNFFGLGGHSLLATRIVARMREQFQVNLPVRAIFDAPTVKQLGELVVAPGAGTLRSTASAATEHSQELREEFEQMREEIDQMEDEQVLAEILQLEKELGRPEGGKPVQV